MNPDLAAFLEHARSKGMDHGTIRMLLLSEGWKEKEVARALAEHALEMPVPAPPDSGGARDAFLYLSAFTALYASAIAAVSLLFDGVNWAVPDPALGDRGYGYEGQWAGARWSIATLLVSFPSFLWISRLLLKELSTQLEKTWSAVRRWLTYLTLFVAAVALATDLVTLVYFLLDGELSVRFVLKVLIVCVVASATLAYYLTTVRMPARTLASSRLHRVFGMGSSGIVLLAFVWGTFVVGTPNARRVRRLDERRVEELQTIVSALDRLCLGPVADRAEGRPRVLVHPLPGSLIDLTGASVETRPRIVDPVTGSPYEYRVTGMSTFELCATFDGKRDEDFSARWNHDPGRHCFVFDLLNPK